MESTPTSLQDGKKKQLKVLQKFLKMAEERVGTAVKAENLME